MHPKGQPPYIFPQPGDPFLHCDHLIYMQLHTMLSASRNITFFPPSCPRAAFVLPLTYLIISQCLQSPLSPVGHILPWRSFPSQQMQPAPAACQGREWDKLLKNSLFIQGFTLNLRIPNLKVTGTSNRKRKYHVSHGIKKK